MGEEGGEGGAVGKAKEFGEGEAARDDVQAEGIGVRRRRLGHVEGKERRIDRGEERERTAVYGVVLAEEKVQLEVGGDDGVAEEVIAADP